MRSIKTLSVILLLVLISASKGVTNEHGWETNESSRKLLRENGSIVVPWHILGLPGLWFPEAEAREIAIELETCDLLEEKHRNALQDLEACKKYSRDQESFTASLEGTIADQARTIKRLRWVTGGAAGIALCALFAAIYGASK